MGNSPHMLLPQPSLSVDMWQMGRPGRSHFVCCHHDAQWNSHPNCLSQVNITSKSWTWRGAWDHWEHLHSLPFLQKGLPCSQNHYHQDQGPFHRSQGRREGWNEPHYKTPLCRFWSLKDPRFSFAFPSSLPLLPLFPFLFHLLFFLTFFSVHSLCLKHFVVFSIYVPWHCVVYKKNSDSRAQCLFCFVDSFIHFEDNQNSNSSAQTHCFLNLAKALTSQNRLLYFVKGDTDPNPFFLLFQSELSLKCSMTARQEMGQPAEKWVIFGTNLTVPSSFPGSSGSRLSCMDRGGGVAPLRDKGGRLEYSHTMSRTQWGLYIVPRAQDGCQKFKPLLADSWGIVPSQSLMYLKKLNVFTFATETKRLWQLISE